LHQQKQTAMTNKLKLTIQFHKIWNNPTFYNLFNRIDIIRNKTAKDGDIVTIVTNHTHLGDIKRMAQIFQVGILKIENNRKRFKN